MDYVEFRDASGRITVGVNGFPLLKYRYIKWRIAKNFKLEKSGGAVNSLNERFQTFCCEGCRVSVDWDVWTGLTVTALDDCSDDLVKEIGIWIKNKYSK